MDAMLEEINSQRLYSTWALPYLTARYKYGTLSCENASPGVAGNCWLASGKYRYGLPRLQASIHGKMNDLFRALGAKAG